MSITLRRAARADIPLLIGLIERSAHGLSAGGLHPMQVAGALRGAFGIDTQLVDDGTYFVAEEAGVLAGCGGWSFRATLFGSDSRTDRDASMLDPRTHAAKIRAFFVEPLMRGAAWDLSCSTAARAKRASGDSRASS